MNIICTREVDWNGAAITTVPPDNFHRESLGVFDRSAGARILVVCAITSEAGDLLVVVRPLIAIHAFEDSGHVICVVPGTPALGAVLAVDAERKGARCGGHDECRSEHRSDAHCLWSSMVVRKSRMSCSDCKGFLKTRRNFREKDSRYGTQHLVDHLSRIV